MPIVLATGACRGRRARATAASSSVAVWARKPRVAPGLLLHRCVHSSAVISAPPCTQPRRQGHRAVDRRCAAAPGLAPAPGARAPRSRIACQPTSPAGRVQRGSGKAGGGQPTTALFACRNARALMPAAHPPTRPPAMPAGLPARPADPVPQPGRAALAAAAGAHHFGGHRAGGAGGRAADGWAGSMGAHGGLMGRGGAATEGAQLTGGRAGGLMGAAERASASLGRRSGGASVCMHACAVVTRGAAPVGLSTLDD